MAGVISTYLRNIMLDHALSGATFFPVSTLYVALYLTPPGADDLGLEVDISGTLQPDGSISNYNRFGQPANLTSWTAAVSGVKNNNSVIAWAPQSGTLGNVTSVGWRDAPTAGHLLFSCDLVTPIASIVGTIFSFPPNTFQILWQ